MKKVLSISALIFLFLNLSVKSNADEVKDCFSTKISITNTSPFDSSKLTKFTWIYGDGSTDTTQWDGRTHTYTTAGNYQIQLAIIDTSGCTKTFDAATSLQSVVLNFNPSISKDTSCFYNNAFPTSNIANFRNIAPKSEARKKLNVLKNATMRTYFLSLKWTIFSTSTPSARNEKTK